MAVERIKRFLVPMLSVLATLAFMAQGAMAEGVTVYKDGDKYLKIGGRINLQYHWVNEETGSAGDETTDDLFFRRLRPFIEGSLHKDWMGKLQLEFGKSSGPNEVEIKDAYLRYLGFKDMKITLGNAQAPFSREVLTSSTKQQTVERTFVGDHNYGTPERNLGIHITGELKDKVVTYGFSAASASIDPDAKKLDFDTPVNEDSDFNEGWLAGARVDFHPLGEVKFEQGDLERTRPRFSVGLAGFVWDNDDDNNTYTDEFGMDASSGKKPDVDSVAGLEISGAFRGMGLSIDAQYNIFDAETVDEAVTAGIYGNGETELENMAVEAGYMLWKDRLEAAAAYERQDADNYETEWTRTSIGANWFIKKHDIKLQFTYRMGEDVDGKEGEDEDEIFVQAQYLF